MANASSVIPCAVESFSSVVVLPSFLIMYELIIKCLKLKMKVPTTIDSMLAPVDTIVTAIIWLPPAKTRTDIIIVSRGEKPASDAITAKAIATGR